MCFLSFAATKKELHDFSPDKEPLLSMLEGEIQAMYMCKPGRCDWLGCHTVGILGYHVLCVRAYSY